MCVGFVAVNARADALAMNVAVARCNASSNLRNALAQRAALVKESRHNAWCFIKLHDLQHETQLLEVYALLLSMRSIPMRNAAAGVRAQ